MSWLWIFLPVALVIIAAVVGLPLWKAIWSHDERDSRATLPRDERVRREATSEDAIPQSRPEHVHL